MARLHPQTINDFLIGTVAAGIAAALPDMDIFDNRAENILEEIYMTAESVVMMAAFAIAAESKCGYMVAYTGLYIYALLAYGTIRSPHRGLSHSFLWAAISTWQFYRTVNDIYCAEWFAIGILSHLIIDFANKKGMRLFWPTKKTYCLKLVDSSNRAANEIIFVIMFLLYCYVAAETYAKGLMR